MQTVYCVLKFFSISRKIDLLGKKQTSQYKNVSAIILAGGRGERMEQRFPKVLNKLGSKPILHKTLDLLAEVGVRDVVIVVGYKDKMVVKSVVDAGYDAKFAKQNQLRGTGHAVKVGMKMISPDAGKVLVIFGDDSGLYKAETIKKFFSSCNKSKSPGTLLTIIKNKPTKLGGLTRDVGGRLNGTMAKAEMETDNVQKHEILCGVLCFQRKWLEENVSKLRKSPASGEYVLPDLIKIAADKGEHLDTFVLEDQNQWQSVNTKGELMAASQKLTDGKR